MRSPLAVMIRKSRRAAGLTQVQLGRRLGLKGRAVYRWERGNSVPSKRNRRALVVALDAVNRDAAAQLAAVMAGEAAGRNAAAGSHAAGNNGGPTGSHAFGAHAVREGARVPSVPQSSAPVALELAIFKLADELDLAPRRIRGPLMRLLERLRDAGLTLDGAREQIKAWIASAQ